MFLLPNKLLNALFGKIGGKVEDCLSKSKAQSSWCYGHTCMAYNPRLHLTKLLTQSIRYSLFTSLLKQDVFCVVGMKVAESGEGGYLNIGKQKSSNDICFTECKQTTNNHNLFFCFCDSHQTFTSLWWTH